ncbi:hypothetical protein ACQUY5_20120 [Bacillus cereus]|uniref:hypothetical protein n=1 Tax=Bacillus cereus TaxID=1396 RepID=UPI003D179DB9
MNMELKRVELHDSLEKAMVFNQNEFELKALTYKVLVVELSGVDVGAYKTILKELDVCSPISIHKQFHSELKVQGLEQIIKGGDIYNTMKYAYKSSFLLLKSELEQLRGVVNQIRLNALLFLIRDFMLNGFELMWFSSNGLEDYNKKVLDKVNELKGRLDKVLNKDMRVTA